MTILVRSNYILIDSYFGRQKRGYGLWPLTSILVVLQLAGTGHRINELLLAVRANVLRITRSFIKVTLHVCICIICILLIGNSLREWVHALPKETIDKPECMIYVLRSVYYFLMMIEYYCKYVIKYSIPMYSYNTY